MVHILKSYIEIRRLCKAKRVSYLINLIILFLITYHHIETNNIILNYHIKTINNQKKLVTENYLIELLNNYGKNLRKKFTEKISFQKI